MKLLRIHMGFKQILVDFFSVENEPFNKSFNVPFTSRRSEASTPTFIAFHMLTQNRDVENISAL